MVHILSGYYLSLLGDFVDGADHERAESYAGAYLGDKKNMQNAEES
jgi:hypothetical protein